MNYTVELHFRVYDDSCGEYVFIGPDADGLGLCDIRYCDKNGIPYNRITASKDMMRLVHNCLGKYLDQTENE